MAWVSGRDQIDDILADLDAVATGLPASKSVVCDDLLCGKSDDIGDGSQESLLPPQFPENSQVWNPFTVSPNSWSDMTNVPSRMAPPTLAAECTRHAAVAAFRSSCRELCATMFSGDANPESGIRMHMSSLDAWIVGRKLIEHVRPVLFWNRFRGG
jgi:hypothetical protein